MLNFILGLITGWNLYLLGTDVIGKDSFIEYCSENWTPSYISAPIHIIVIIICIIISIGINK